MSQPPQAQAGKQFSIEPITPYECVHLHFRLCLFFRQVTRYEELVVEVSHDAAADSQELLQKMAGALQEVQAKMAGAIQEVQAKVAGFMEAVQAQVQELRVSVARTTAGLGTRCHIHSAHTLQDARPRRMSSHRTWTGRKRSAISKMPCRTSRCLRCLNPCFTCSRRICSISGSSMNQR